ncbi:hypothetical protein M231_05619 [Tremella mesenterica]|uniref:Uncharacterized protein n=1 Tax=Tremella mesenterica TaxID=5217 RepID=A0A4Q1BHL6_TREME|nr:hypothetical protein M231_05619 [Tremella mesenterica]
MAPVPLQLPLPLPLRLFGEALIKSKGNRIARDQARPRTGRLKPWALAERPRSARDGDRGSRLLVPGGTRIQWSKWSWTTTTTTTSAEMFGLRSYDGEKRHGVGVVERSL